MVTCLLPRTELQKTLSKTILQAINHLIWFRNYKRNGELPVQCFEERAGHNRGEGVYVDEELHWLIDIGEVEKTTCFESVNVGCGEEESPLLSLADCMAEGWWDFYFGGCSRWHYNSAFENHHEGL